MGDPTEAAVVVLAEKIGVSVAETRRAYPRVATVPFDSTYKIHRLGHDGLRRDGTVHGRGGLRDAQTTASAFARPTVPAALLTLAGVAITIASTEVGFLQDWLRTTPLTNPQWAACLALALALLFSVAGEAEKAVRRRSTGGR